MHINIFLIYVILITKRDNIVIFITNYYILIRFPIILIRPSLFTKKNYGEKYMTDVKMSKQLQDQIARLQQMRNQLQMLMQQRQQIEIRLKEVEEAVTEIEKTDDDTPIFKSVGSVLIKTKGKKNILKELKSDQESLELRKNTLTKQEGATKEKLNELQSKVQNALSAGPEDDEE